MIRALRSIFDTILMIIAPDERGSYFITKPKRPNTDRDKETKNDR